MEIEESNQQGREVVAMTPTVTIVTGVTVPCQLSRRVGGLRVVTFLREGVKPPLFFGKAVFRQEASVDAE